MEGYQLKDIDSLDIDEVLIRIEKLFNINFADEELAHILTFGQLCDYIKNKILLDDSGGCTSQQAFYKLRGVICATLDIEKSQITTNTALVNIFPKQNRRKQIKKTEAHLGFSLDILQPPNWVTSFLLLLLLGSFVGFFFNGRISLIVFLICLVGFRLSSKMGNVFELETVGQVAEKMTQEHYIKSRRNAGTFNSSEIENILVNIFSAELDLEKSALTREAAFS